MVSISSEIIKNDGKAYRKELCSRMVSLVKVAINRKIEYCNNKKNYLKIDVI